MPAELSPIDKAKFVAAKRAVEFVESGMKVGLGTGSTAAWMVRCLGERIREEAARMGYRPDLTILGKAIGGGTPFSALAGTRAAMAKILSGEVVQAGTLNGKPVMSGQWGPSVSKNPFLQFSVKGAKAGDKIAITWKDNKGDSRTDEAGIA